MAINKQEAARKRITRGVILYMLYLSQDVPTMVSTIELSMLPEYPQISTELLPQINYLADRGYIKVIEPDNPIVNPMRGVLVRITDKGQDMVDGSVQDGGVCLPRCDKTPREYAYR